MLSLYHRIRIFLTNRACHYIPLRFIAPYRGVVSFDDMFDRVKKMEPVGELPPHFNEIIEVPGLTSGKCRWFSRVDDLKPDDPVLIFFHGGGYALSFEWQHVEFINQVATYGQTKGLSVVVLDYTLTTYSEFPQQLIEAAATFEAVSKLSRNLILMGDSAGGHLCLSLLRHLHTPFVEVPRVSTSVRPNVLIAISPWLDMSPGEPEEGSSWITYMYKDLFTHACINGLGEMLFAGKDKIEGTIAHDVKAMHRRRDINWREILPPNVLITYGETEVFRDSIEEFVKIAGVDEKGTVFKEPDAIHDSPIVHPLQDNVTVHAILAFLDQILG